MMMEKERINSPAFITTGWKGLIFVYVSLLFKVLRTKKGNIWWLTMHLYWLRSHPRFPNMKEHFLSTETPKRKVSEDRIKVEASFAQGIHFAVFRTWEWDKCRFSGLIMDAPNTRGTGGGCVWGWLWCKTLWGLLIGPIEGIKPCWPKWGARSNWVREPCGWLPHSEVLCCCGIPCPSPPSFVACPCLLTALAEFSSFIDLFVSSCRALQDQPQATGKLWERQQRRREQALKSEALQPSQETAVPKCEMIV